MRFKVIKTTSTGNILLSGEKKPVEKTTRLYEKNNQVAIILETIGKVENPLFLGKATNAKSENLVGKTLQTKTF